jgi:hypothetical protein
MFYSKYEQNTTCRTESAQAAVDMLSKVYGVPSMKMVFQHIFPINDMVCKDALAVYYGDDMTAFFKPEGTSISTILHEFYHHLLWSKRYARLSSST